VQSAQPTVARQNVPERCGKIQRGVASFCLMNWRIRAGTKLSLAKGLWIHTPPTLRTYS